MKLGVSKATVYRAIQTLSIHEQYLDGQTKYYDESAQKHIKQYIRRPKPNKKKVRKWIG